MKYTFYIVLFTTLISCIRNKVLTDVRDTNQNEKKAFEIMSDSTVLETTFYRSISCSNQNKGEINKPSQVTLSNFELRFFVNQCVRINAFKGDENSISLLLGYLDFSGAKGFNLKPEKFRGEALFSKLKELSWSDKCYEEGIDRGWAHAKWTFEALKEMIESIDGVSVHSFCESKFDEFDFEQELCKGVTTIRMFLEPIDQAWKEGKVKLKDFGVQ